MARPALATQVLASSSSLVTASFVDLAASSSFEDLTRCDVAQDQIRLRLKQGEQHEVGEIRSMPFREEDLRRVELSSVVYCICVGLAASLILSIQILVPHSC